MGLTNLLRRLGIVAEAKANAAIDQIEDPVEMTKQGIRMMSETHQRAVEAEVKLKALVIQRRSDAEKATAEAKTWEDKANKILDKIENKSLTEEEGNRLAAEALKQQQIQEGLAKKATGEADFNQKSLDAVDKKIRMLKADIEEAKSNLTNLEARQKTAEVSKEVNKELSDLSFDNTKAMMKRMVEKTEALEHEAQAYSELEDSHMTAMEEIDKVLNEDTSAGNNALEALKAKRKAASTQGA